MDEVTPEFPASADVFLDELLEFRKGESLLIFLDERDDPRVAAAIESQALARGGRADRLLLDSGQALADRARCVTDRIRSGAFNAICELSCDYYYLTSVWEAANQAGARVYCLGGLNAGSFVRCVGQVDHRRLFDFGMALKAILSEAETIGITSPGGTDIRMRMNTSRSREIGRAGRLLRTLRRSVRRLTLRLGLNRLTALLRTPEPQDFLFEPAGRLNRDGATFLSGQLSFRGIPATIDGTVVIDGYLWPTGEIGPNEEPVILKFEKGALVKIEGCQVKAAALIRRLQGPQAHLEHFCIGLNPGAAWTGNLLEVERVFGAINVGFGKGFVHTDGVIRKPSLTVNDTVILDNYCFRPALLAEFADKLSRPARGPENSMGAGCNDEAS